MGNTYLTADLISKEAAALFDVENTMLNTGNRMFEGMLTNQTYKPGASINMRLDNRYLPEEGDTITAQDIVDRSLPLTIQPLVSVGVEIVPTDLQREISDFSENILQPAIKAIVGKVNTKLTEGAINTLYQHTGAVGTSINSFATVNNTRARMLEMGIASKRSYYLNMSVNDAAALQNSLSNQFNEPLNSKILRDSMLGRLAGFDILSDQSIATHSGNTAAAGSPTVNGAVSSGSSIVTANWTANYDIKKGTLISIAGVKSMNPILHTATTSDMEFVITADVTADGAGAATITVSPSIVSAATALQNVSVAIPDTAAITVNQNYIANLAYSDMALYVATPPLPAFPGVDSSTARSKDFTTAIRISMDSTIFTNRSTMRVDVQYAYAWNPEMAFILMS